MSYSRDLLLITNNPFIDAGVYVILNFAKKSNILELTLEDMPASGSRDDTLELVNNHILKG